MAEINDITLYYSGVVDNIMGVDKSTVVVGHMIKAANSVSVTI